MTTGKDHANKHHYSHPQVMVPTELQSLPTGKVTKLGSTTFLDLQKLLSKRSSAQQESQTAAPPLEAVAIAPTADPWHRLQGERIHYRQLLRGTQ